MKSRGPGKITMKLEEFAVLAVQLDNASEAYRQVYPRARKWKDESVHKQASQVLAKPHVASRVAELRADRVEKFKREAERQGLSPQDVIEEQAMTGFLDPRRLFDEKGTMLPLHKLPEEIARAVKKVKVRGIQNSDGEVSDLVVVEVEMCDKLRALRDIGDHLGMYKQVHEHHWISELASMTEGELEAEEQRIDAELARAMQEREQQTRLDS